MNEAIPVISITRTETRSHQSIGKAAETFGISRYTVLTCCFTGKCLRDGTCFDLALDVTPEQEKVLYRTWSHSRETSIKRRFNYGKFDKEL